LVGFFIGAALWTKNEGFAFFMAIIVSEVINVLSSPHGFSAQIKRWLFISYGCLPFIVSVILLKTTLAPSNDLIIGTTINEIINKIFDPARFMMIGNHFFKQIIAPWSFRVPLVLLLIFYLLTVGLDKNKVLNRGIKMFGMRLGLTASFYFVVYLITPRPLEWHLNSSVDRLFMQLLPSFILFIFLAAKNPFFVENTNL